MSFKVITKEHIFEKDKFFPECHASTLILLDNDEVIAAWFGGTEEKNKDVAIWSSRRKEGKWSVPQKIADMPDVPCWNPVLFKGDQENIYLFYKVGDDIIKWRTMLTISDDNGCSWSESIELVEGDVGGRGPVKNKPIKLSDGTWLAPASVETESAWDAFTDASKDQGKTWTKSGMVPIEHEKLNGKGVCQPTLWESKSGIVHMLLRSTEGSVYRSDSNDNGFTWCKAYPIDLPNNNSGIDLVKMDNGVLVLAYNPVKGDWADRTPIVCSISRDNGITWEDEFVLEHNENFENRKDGEFSYPAVITSGNDIYITFTYKRKTIEFYKLSVM